MRVLIAFDKFKDALGAEPACYSVARVLQEKHPDWQLDLCPLTDGGEGFTETLTHSANGRHEPVDVTDPRGRLVIAAVGAAAYDKISPAARARLALEKTEHIAIVDLASASGISRLLVEQRDPWLTTTYGTGQLLRAAATRGHAILLGIGGSATNDLGLGALAALGFKFLDAAGATVAVPAPATWERIQRVDCSSAIKLPRIFIACDVINTLLGPHGATATFGPQKGLKPEDLPRLEAQAARMAALLCEACGQPPSLADTPGAGAAGGIGFGLMVAYGAKLVPGFDLVSDWLGLPLRLVAADLVLTGEGRFDATSLGGKGPGRLVAEARRLGKPVHVFAGSLGVPADEAFHCITPAGLPLAEALPRTAELLAASVGRVL